jgi:hypothetical protein
VNLALAIKTLVGLDVDPEADAKAVCELLGGYDHVKEYNAENLTELLRRVNNGY